MFQLDFMLKLSILERLLWFFGFSVTGWLLSKLILLIWEKLILPFVSKTNSSLDDHLAKNLHKPIARLLILGSVYLSSELSIASAEEVKNYVSLIDSILYLILVVIIANVINGLLKSFIDWYLQDIASKTESQLDDTIFPILRKTGTIIIYFIASTIVLSQFKVNLTGFLATAGVASLAIAFGAQETLSNIIAGISLLIDRSFHVGERIELKDGLIGDVIEIGLRSTRVLSLDKRLIIIPNKEIAGSRLINWTQPDAATKIKLKIGIGPEEDLEKVKRVILDVCNNEATLIPESGSVVYTGFGPYYIEVLLVAEVNDYRDSGKAVDNLIMKLQKRFQQENINLPIPQQFIEYKQKA